MAAKRFNTNKAQWGLLPRGPLKHVVRVLEFGAFKYGPDNWKKGLNRVEILESLQRHLDALFEGEEFDPEKKSIPTHHAAHIICNALFYLWHNDNDSFVERNVKYGETFNNKKQDEQHRRPARTSRKTRKRTRAAKKN
jgi:hypothetical protein